MNCWNGIDWMMVVTVTSLLITTCPWEHIKRANLNRESEQNLPVVPEHHKSSVSSFGLLYFYLFHSYYIKIFYSEYQLLFSFWININCNILFYTFATKYLLSFVLSDYSSFCIFGQFYVNHFELFNWIWELLDFRKNNKTNQQQPFCDHK